MTPEQQTQFADALDQAKTLRQVLKTTVARFHVLSRSFDEELTKLEAIDLAAHHPATPEGTPRHD